MTSGQESGTLERLDEQSVATRLFVPQRTEREAWERALLHSATPVPVDAAPPAVSWGAGPPVLLVHGWQGRGTQLGSFVEPIVRTGHRVIAVDAPGHGDSPDTLFTPTAFADVLIQVQREVGPLGGVVAHSMGTAAVMVALRGGLRTASLVLIAPLPSFTQLVQRAGAALGIAPGTLAGSDFVRVVEKILGRPVADLDLDPALASRAAVLLCHDATDKTIPVESTRQLARDWPQAVFVETAGLGHFEILAEPSVLSAAAVHIAAASAGGW